ncbi:MAG: hypothetical protein RLZZ387_3492 [Chloroflexota bacterium]
MPSHRRITRPLMLILFGLLLGATLTPLAMRAGQQLFSLSPGDSILVTCETGLGSTVSGSQARIECAQAGEPGAVSGAAVLPTPTAARQAMGVAQQPGGPLSVRLAGVRDGQTARGTLAVEAVVSGAAQARVVFALEGPQLAQHTEKRAPYFFLGDEGGRPRGWDTTAALDGDYTLRVTVTGADGQTAEASARIRVANGAASTAPTAAAILSSQSMVAAPGAAPQAAPRTVELEYGAAAHLFYLDRAAPLGAAKDIGLGWVRQQIHWKDLEGPEPGNYAWGELDPLVESVDGAGLKLLLSVVRSPRWYTADGGDGMPQDPRSLGNFVAALAERYKGRVDAIEIWNEQNLAHENGGRVTIEDAGHYVELLKEAYTRIEAVDPAIVVLAAPPSSTGITDPAVAVSDIDYLKAMYGYQGGVVRGFMDAQAVHPGAAANPPETFVTDTPSPAAGWTDHPTFYFRHIENVRALMEQHGMADKPVWITEFGWATQNSSPGYEFGNAVSYEQQADYTVRAMRWTRERYPWVQAMFVWNLNFAPLKAKDGRPLDEQASFSLLDTSGKPRPVYYAMRRHLAEGR